MRRFIFGELGEVTDTRTGRSLGSIQFIRCDSFNVIEQQALAEWQEWLASDLPLAKAA